MNKYRWSTASEIYDEAYCWQYRVLRASIGTTTGSIVMATLGYEPMSGPVFGKHCDIRLDGIVVTDLRGENGKWLHNFPIGTIEAVRDNVRRLADHCKLNDKDRTEMVKELKRWVRKDYRAIAGLTPGEK